MRRLLSWILKRMCSDFVCVANRRCHDVTNDVWNVSDSDFGDNDDVAPAVRDHVIAPIADAVPFSLHLTPVAHLHRKRKWDLWRRLLFLLLLLMLLLLLGDHVVVVAYRASPYRWAPNN